MGFALAAGILLICGEVFWAIVAFFVFLVMFSKEAGGGITRYMDNQYEQSFYTRLDYMSTGQRIIKAVKKSGLEVKLAELLPRFSEEALKARFTFFCETPEHRKYAKVYDEPDHYAKLLARFKKEHPDAIETPYGYICENKPYRWTWCLTPEAHLRYALKDVNDKFPEFISYKCTDEKMMRDYAVLRAKSKEAAMNEKESDYPSEYFNCVIVESAFGAVWRRNRYSYHERLELALTKYKEFFPDWDPETMTGKQASWDLDYKITRSVPGSINYPKEFEHNKSLSRQKLIVETEYGAVYKSW